MDESQEEKNQPEMEPPGTEISEPELRMALETFRSEQNLPFAVVAGSVAALGGAAIWGVITAFTQYQIGWMAIGVGFLVGVAVRFAGKGIDTVFGVLSAILSLAGCLLGNLWTMVYFISVNEGVPFLEVVAKLNLGITINILTATFSYMDLLFYGIALYFGYKYGFRQITQEDLKHPSLKGV